MNLVPINAIPKAVDVPTNDLLEVFRVCVDMEKVCVVNDGIGLSAVQVGIPWKLFVVRTNYGFEHYINCSYKGLGKKVVIEEGCLSIKENGKLKMFNVERYEMAQVFGHQLIATKEGLSLKEVNMILKDMYAIVFQHEIDHHFSILISDIGKPIVD